MLVVKPSNQVFNSCTQSNNINLASYIHIISREIFIVPNTKHVDSIHNSQSCQSPVTDHNSESRTCNTIIQCLNSPAGSHNLLSKQLDLKNSFFCWVFLMICKKMKKV